MAECGSWMGEERHARSVLICKAPYFGFLFSGRLIGLFYNDWIKICLNWTKTAIYGEKTFLKSRRCKPGEFGKKQKNGRERSILEARRNAGSTTQTGRRLPLNLKGVRQMEIRIPTSKLYYSMKLLRETKPSAPRTVNILIVGVQRKPPQTEDFNIVHTVENLKEGGRND